MAVTFIYDPKAKNKNTFFSETFKVREKSGLIFCPSSL